MGMANDNNKAATAKEVTGLADAIFNKCSAISGTAERSTVVRLLNELGALVTRAENTRNSRSKDANALLVKAVARAAETTRAQCA
jgi:hypothetical protein